ncbi:hypothetical protein AURDEDRAFT_127775 [Auricularia subglabra TFB-10046 SS5]|nr:hypothetical protein AURDEDRAFT_127775 [Auricularia subglabra TFB-10046 SS5]
MSNQDIIVRDDNTDFVSYFQPEQWTSSAGDSQTPSSHHTSAAFAYVRFAFTGSYVAYYSDRAADHGEFEVELDGVPALRGNASNPTPVQSQLLFSKTVSPGDHTLRVTNQEARVMGVQYFVQVSSSAPPRTLTLPDFTSYRAIVSTTSQPGASSPAPTDSRSRTSTSLAGGSQTSETSLSCQQSSTQALDPQTACPRRGPSKGHIPLIVGLLCGLLVPLLVVAVILTVKWRKNRRTVVPLPQPPAQEEPLPPPLVATSHRVAGATHLQL